MTGFACRSQHGVHSEVHVGDHIAQQNHNHELTGVWQCHLGSTEEKQASMNRNPMIRFSVTVLPNRCSAV